LNRNQACAGFIVRDAGGKIVLSAPESAYAELYDLELTEVIVDAGESAKHLEPWEWSWPRAAGYSWYLVLDSRAERAPELT
jgi:hypothetical protein